MKALIRVLVIFFVLLFSCSLMTQVDLEEDTKYMIMFCIGFFLHTIFIILHLYKTNDDETV